MRDTQINVILERLNGDVIKCSAENWFGAYAPSAGMDPELLEEILLSLHSTSDYPNVLLDDCDGWIKYHREKRYGEVEGFLTFEDVVDTIRKVVREYDPEKYAEPTTIQNTSASVSTKSDTRGYRFCEDWIFASVKSCERSTSTRQIGTRFSPLSPKPIQITRSDIEAVNSTIIAGFKVEDDEETRSYNEKWIAGNATDVLYKDPRRSSVAGLTIEASSLRMWHFSRSHVARSELVNINKNPDFLVRFFFFALFASLDDLGLDSTVTRHPVRNPDWKESYEKGLEEFKFVYREDISNVWETDLEIRRLSYCFSRHPSMDVTEVNDNKSPDEVDADARSPNGAKLHKVLKDVWLNEDGKPEREIQNKIIGALPEHLRADAQCHLLNIDAEGFIGGKNGIALRCERWRDVRWSFERGFITSGKTVHVATRDGAQQAQARAHRRHHRTIFANVCKSVYELDEYGEFFTCALGVVKGLLYMKRANYIHRDASAENCLIHTDPETGVMTGKISDLEYALRYDSITTNIARLGTPDFMAVECQDLEYSNIPQPPTDSPDLEEVLSLLTSSQSTIVTPTQSSDPPTHLVFIPSFLHDLESVVWQYIWMLHFRVPVPLVEDKSGASLVKYRIFLQGIQHSRQSLFSKGMDGSASRYGFIVPTHRSGQLKIRLEALYGRTSPLLRPLSLLHRLRHAYKRAEAADPVNILDGNGEVMVGERGWVLQRLPPSAFDDGLYQEMILMFDSLKGVKCVLKDIDEWENELDRETTPTTPQKSVKRVAATMEEDDSEREGIGEPLRKVVKDIEGER